VIPADPYGLRLLLVFQVTGAFAEFERSMIRQRIGAGLSIIKAKIERDGQFVSKAGKVRRSTARFVRRLVLSHTEEDVRPLPR
jgi:DNA invertase Pin-like site-specific DNA recombinase